MIIILKDKETVYVAASVDATYTATHPEDILNPENLKVWRAAGSDNTLMASFNPNSPCIDLLRYTDFEVLHKPLTSPVMIREVCPTLKEFYAEQQALDEEELWSSLVIAKEDKAFLVKPNFTVCDVEDFECIGFDTSEDVAFGFLTMNPELSPIERIAGAFRAVEAGGGNKQFPIVIMNTKTGFRTVIER